jgi:hypothetical protein
MLNIGQIWAWGIIMVMLVLLFGLFGLSACARENAAIRKYEQESAQYSCNAGGKTACEWLEVNYDNEVMVASYE